MEIEKVDYEDFETTPSLRKWKMLQVIHDKSLAQTKKMDMSRGFFFKSLGDKKMESLHRSERAWFEAANEVVHMYAGLLARLKAQGYKIETYKNCPIPEFEGEVESIRRAN